MTTDNSLLHPKYRADIDGLRAIAVLSVVGFHAFPQVVRGGFVGVDIFFVISGFLISTIIIDSLATGRFSYAMFYARRIRRIFPALIVVLCVCLLIGWMVLFADEFRLLGKHIFLGAAFLSNIGLWREAGYFDQRAHVKVLLHLWSLGIEEQFYILWPLLLALAFKRRVNILLVAISLSAISFVASVVLIRNHPEAAFYLPASRLWELTIGAAVAYAKRDASNVRRRSADWLGWAGITLLIASIFGIDSSVQFPGWWALLPTAGAVMMIAAGPETAPNRRLLSMRPFVWFGLISYPLYLWHWPLLTFARILNNGLPSATARVEIVLLSILLAWLTYRLLERPIRFSHEARGAPLYLSAVMAALALSGLWIFAAQGVPARAAAHTVTPGLLASDAALLDPDSLPAAYNCVGWFKANDIDRCATNTATPQILILGDSHAGHLYPGLLTSDLPVAVLWNAGCPPTLDLRMENRCAHRWQILLDFVRAHLSSVRLVVLSTDYSLYLQPKSLSGFENHEYEVITQELGNSKDTGQRFDSLSGGSEAIITALKAPGIRVAFLNDVPALPYEARTCLRRRFLLFSDTTACRPTPRALITDYETPMLTLEARLVLNHPDLQTFDPTSAFCDAEFCSAILQNRLLYWDDNHLNEAGSSLLADSLEPWLRAESQ